jgi:hypothetical protein
MNTIRAQFHTTRKRNHPALQTYNTWAHKRGYTAEFYSLTEVLQFSTEIFKTPDKEHICRNVQCTSDENKNFKIKKSGF